MIDVAKESTQIENPYDQKIGQRNETKKTSVKATPFRLLS